MTEALDPQPLLRALAVAGVDHIIIGGFAVNAHGVIRPSKDLDIVPDPSPDNLSRLALLLRELDATHVGLGDFDADEFPFDPTDPEDLAAGANFRLQTRLGDLDIMQRAVLDLMSYVITHRDGWDERDPPLSQLRKLDRWSSCDSLLATWTAMHSSRQ